MMPYYQFYPYFQNPFYVMQNMTPFATFDYMTGLKQQIQISQVKQEDDAQKILENEEIAQNSQEKDLSQRTDEKIKSHDFSENLKENQFFQKSQDSIPSDSHKAKKTKLIEKERPKDSKRKVQRQKKDKAYVAKQYPKQEPSLSCRYIQKNFELNIINQVFSFLWSEEKSMKYVKRFFGDSIKENLFYEFIKIVRKFCKRYINKEYLKNLCNYQPTHIAYKMVTKNQQKLEYLSMEQFSKCVKHLIFIYLHQLCPQAILTSKKMRKQIWQQHLRKCRLLRNFMFYNLSSDEYQNLLIRSDYGNFNPNQKMKEDQLC